MADEPKSQSDPSSSSVPPSAKGLTNVPTRTWISVLTGLAALFTSAAAYLHPNETSARKSYDVLAAALEAEARASAQNHDDVVALRKYLEDNVKAREEPQPLVVEHVVVPPDAGAHPIVPAPSTTVIVKTAIKPPSPPKVGDVAPPKFIAPSYEHVTGKSDLPL